MLKNPASNRFWEGHDFSRTAKSSKIGRALAPEVGFLLRKRVLQQPVQPCRSAPPVRRALALGDASAMPRISLDPFSIFG